MSRAASMEVMLPHYGRVDLMQAAVQSVLDQDDPDWLLTVVDDSADDDVAAWCASRQDTRIRYVRNERNLGINRNFQKCVSLVTSDLAVIIGSDDLMLPNYVGTVRSAHAAHPDAAVIQPGVEVIDEHGNAARALVDLSKRWIYTPRVSGRAAFAGEELAASLLRGNWLYFPSLCWRAEPLTRVGFRDGFSVVQDLALMLDLIEAKESLLVEPTTCFQYRRHSGSVSAGQALTGSRFDEERAFFMEVADRLDARGWHRASLAARRHLSSRINALTLIPTAVRAGQSDGVRALARHAFGRGRPSHPQPPDAAFRSGAT